MSERVSKRVSKTRNWSSPTHPHTHPTPGQGTGQPKTNNQSTRQSWSWTTPPPPPHPFPPAKPAQPTPALPSPSPHVISCGGRKYYLHSPQPESGWGELQVILFEGPEQWWRSLHGFFIWSDMAFRYEYSGRGNPSSSRNEKCHSDSRS